MRCAVAVATSVLLASASTAQAQPGASPPRLPIKKAHQERGVLGLLAGVGAGTALGMNLGLAFGITKIANHEGGKGSFLTSLGLGLAGSGVGWLVVLGSGTDDGGVIAITFVALPVIGTMSGYWLTHKHTAVTVVPTGDGVALTGRF